MSRHAAPLTDYTEAESAARLTHSQMLEQAMAHVTGLSAAWTTIPTGYALDPDTGTLKSLLGAATTG